MRFELTPTEAVVLGTAAIVLNDLVGPFFGPNVPTPDEQKALKEFMLTLQEIMRQVASEDLTPTAILSSEEYQPLMAISNKLIHGAEFAHKSYHSFIQQAIVPNN